MDSSLESLLSMRLDLSEVGRRVTNDIQEDAIRTGEWALSKLRMKTKTPKGRKLLVDELTRSVGENLTEDFRQKFNRIINRVSNNSDLDQPIPPDRFFEPVFLAVASKAIDEMPETDAENIIPAETAVALVNASGERGYILFSADIGFVGLQLASLQGVAAYFVFYAQEVGIELNSYEAFIRILCILINTKPPSDIVNPSVWPKPIHVRLFGETLKASAISCVDSTSDMPRE
ncbi:hypothetical protein [uncultured Roseobacter sp.]|uniref:hypothetical protein n=1 Tax=uncultured Roseobacter sp. TaxID=114847 RepID=UPI002614E497|nr:hypothetical protein [uncultured Roseobacter sp.]